MGGYSGTYFTCTITNEGLIMLGLNSYYHFVYVWVWVSSYMQYIICIGYLLIQYTVKQFICTTGFNRYKVGLVIATEGYGIIVHYSLYLNSIWH